MTDKQKTPWWPRNPYTDGHAERHIGWERCSDAIHAAYQEHEAEPCVWTWDETHCYYETGCGNAFTFTYNKREKEFVSCPYCGQPIKESEATDES